MLVELKRRENYDSNIYILHRMFNSPGKGQLRGGSIDQYEEEAQQLLPMGVSGLQEAAPIGEEPLFQESRRTNHMFTSPPPPYPGFKKDFFNPTPRNSLRLRSGTTGHAYEQNFEQERQEPLLPQDYHERTLYSNAGPNPSQLPLDFSPYEDIGARTPPKIKNDDLEGKQSTASNSHMKTAKTVPSDGHPTALIPMLHESLSSKGLKNLSESVRRAVAQLGQATYKEVAHMLIKSLQRQNLITQTFRDEQNIKRRVYDALNVFVSANVLVKDGKYVSIRNKKFPHGADLKKQREELQDAISTAQLNLQEKFTRLVALRNKFLANEYLIARNKQGQTPADSRIQFPFIAIISKFPPESPLSVVDHRRIKLIFKPPGFRIAGDIDTILELGFHESGQPSKLNRKILQFSLDSTAEEGFSPCPLTPLKPPASK